jgi:hypothetical protein
MRSDLTDITLVIDRSGSMAVRVADAEGGVNAFVEEQRRAPGETNLTVEEFDDRYELLFQGPISQMKPYRLRPRGWTALLDAVGRAINNTGERLSGLPEDQRPGCVIFVVVTDGKENASREYSKTQVNEMIERQEREYNWHFTYLGCDPQGFDEARGMGFAPDSIGAYGPAKIQHAFSAASSACLRARSDTLMGRKADFRYTGEEREAMA